MVVLQVYAGHGGKASKVAVKSVSFAVRPGECLGLLGPNGAGKTTCQAMLSGAIEPSSGTALIGGYNVGTHIDYVYKFLGVCPQFDSYWPSLTVQESLLLIARCKGVASSHILAEVQSTAHKVGLAGDAYSTPARYGVAGEGVRMQGLTRCCCCGKHSNLSGGMRRRLSLAMALIGDASVVLLDEPSMLKWM